MPSTQWNAGDYARNSRGQFGWALSVIERLELPAQVNLVDLGCGDGKVTAELAKRVPDGHVVGIDNSPGMIEFARTTWCHQLSNIEFQLADVQSFELPGVFDLAFSNSALHWVPDHLSILKCVNRVLKPAGRVVFSMGGRGTAATALRVMEDFSREGQWAEYLADVQSPHHFFGPGEYLQWLPKAGFRATRVALVPKPIQRHLKDGFVPRGCHIPNVSPKIDVNSFCTNSPIKY